MSTFASRTIRWGGAFLLAFMQNLVSAALRLVPAMSAGITTSHDPPSAGPR